MVTRQAANSSAQAFRDRIIAEQIENLPTELLQLLETAEQYAQRLLHSQNRLVAEEHNRLGNQAAQATSKQDSATKQTANEEGRISSKRRSRSTRRRQEQEDNMA